MKRYLISTEEHAREKKTMLPELNHKKRAARYVSRIFAAALMIMIITICWMNADAAIKQKGFASAEEAVKAYIAAARADDNKELVAIFGPEVKEIMFSGDSVRDKQRRERFLRAYDEKSSLSKEGEKVILCVGEKDWPLPIPLVKKGDQWFFDTKAGKEEILNRRIGRNELDTIQTLLAMVDAQREYAIKDRDGDGIPEYAGKFESDPGKKNGLYWKTAEGEEPSPLGELAAQAKAAGYKRTGSKGDPVPFHGYYFLMLKKQGKHAPGGAYDYVVKGQQIGGFAIVAYPSQYGNSGIMTFMVNHDGVVYEKDLGKGTAKKAKSMKSFDPDKTWKISEKAQ